MTPGKRPVVEIRGLWTLFGPPENRVTVHENLDLTVYEGEIVSLVGGSGTGKTTVLREILGLIAPTRGNVTVLGRPAWELAGPGAATRVGMLFQQGALFSAFSVLDNIALPIRELGTIPDDVVRDMALLKLVLVGLKVGDAAKMPADLSGGMVKRAALARALVLDPPLLLLDEPTAGLDPEASDDFCALLHSLKDELGFTVVMVSHDLDTVIDLSTRIAVLADRKVLVNGSIREVIANPHPFIQHYFLGPRGRRALKLLDEAHDPTTGRIR